MLGVIEPYLAGLADIDREEATAWAAEQRDLGARGEYFCAVIQACFTATRSR
jgi:hypothetical protein